VDLHHQERHKVQRAGKGDVEKERHQGGTVEVPSARSGSIFGNG
jgi:hypothetical protein